jgi:hypothetical protein
MGMSDFYYAPFIPWIVSLGRALFFLHHKGHGFELRSVVKQGDDSDSTTFTFGYTFDCLVEDILRLYIPFRNLLNIILFFQLVYIISYAISTIQEPHVHDSSIESWTHKSVNWENTKTRSICLFSSYRSLIIRFNHEAKKFQQNINSWVALARVSIPNAHFELV